MNYFYYLLLSWELKPTCDIYDTSSALVETGMLLILLLLDPHLSSASFCRLLATSNSDSASDRY